MIDDLFRVLFDETPLGVVVQDASGAIREANRAALHLLGAASIDELRGTTSHDPRWKSVREDGSDLPGVEHPSMVTLRTGEEVAGFVMGIASLDGAVRRWLRVASTPLRSADGALAAVFATFEDITAWWEVERELAERTAVLEAVLATTPVGFALIGPDERFIRVNQALAEINGRSPEEHVGRVVHEVVPSLADANRVLFEQVVRERRSLTGIEITGEVPSTPGQERAWLVDYHPVTVGDVLVGIGATVVEVTERRRSERLRAELQQRRHEAEMREVESALQHEAEAVRLLQEAVTPEALPAVAGWTAAARYVSASTSANVGGDWYDLVPLSGGRVAVVVGDVVGHGLEAARTMLQLRSWARLVVADAASPTEALVRLDDAIRRFHPEAMATALVAVMDPLTGMVRWATAGHPPPVLRTAGGAELLEAHRVGSPLGSGGAPPADTSAGYEPGDVLVCYTDGLVERRGEGLDAGFGRLVSVTATSVDGVDALCDTLVTRLLPVDVRRDDACVIAVVATPTP